jgi:dienelactone hydrolase
MYLVPKGIHRRLDTEGTIPEGMVRVGGANVAAGALGDFFIDKYEVTNRRYKEFIDKGGYRDPRFWKHKFVRDGKELSWTAAMAEFRDQSGVPGPSTWLGGDYPKGQENHPVSGVSWYEAAAYAEFAGKSLPTLWHWATAAGTGSPLSRGFGWITQQSNFRNEGPAAVGSFPSMTLYGAYDLPGNVREWCWNQTQNGRVVRGGAWSDATYMISNISQAPEFDRSPKNGFRCTRYPDPGEVPPKALEPYAISSLDLRKHTPVADSVFQVYKEQFAYDAKELRPTREWRKEDSPDWIEEKVTVDAAYGEERLPIFVFLPKNSPPPYQTVIYFPGSGSVAQASSRNLTQYTEFDRLLTFLVKSGRAVVYPVYKGTFERRDDAIARIHEGAPTRQFTEFLIQIVRDFKRTVDYLETRRDLDRSRFAYFGFSWGGELAPVMLSTDDRIRAAILLVGGVHGRGRTEAFELNYAPRVKTPTLMLNGRYDMTFPLETKVRPLFDLLGTPPEQKQLKVYDADHFVPRAEMIKETLAWLDRYLGPVK